jgi:hypothetical protein
MTPWRAPLCSLSSVDVKLKCRSGLELASDLMASDLDADTGVVKATELHTACSSWERFLVGEEESPLLVVVPCLEIGG